MDLEAAIPILVSVIALVVSIYNLVSSNKWIKLKNTFEVLDLFYEELNDETIPEELRLISDSWQTQEQAEVFFGEKDNKKIVYDVLNKYEIFALKIKQNYIESAIVRDFYRKLIVDYYENVISVYLEIISDIGGGTNSDENADSNNDANLQFELYQNITSVYIEWSK